jgi:hypothetical protein
MGQTSVTTVIGDIVASTLPNVRQEIVDNIHKQNVYLSKMLINKRKKTFDGGADIRRTVEYALNTTTNSFTGWDTLPIVPQETLTDSIWTPKNYSANWAVSWEEERKNSGSRTKIRDIVEQKKGSMERSFSEDLTADILNPASFTAVGNGGKDITPLSMLVSLSTSLTVGSIAESSNSWWANQRKKSVSASNTPTAGSVVLKEMRNAYNLTGKYGDGFTDFGLCTQLAYELYESILDNKVRYGSTQMATLGFDTVMLKNCELAWDQRTPGTTANGAAYCAFDSGSYAEETIFFLNTKYLYLMVDSGADFVMTPAVSHQPGGQFGTSGAILARLEQICTNRRAQCIYYGLDESAVTLTT